MTVREVTNAIIKKTGVTIPEEKTCDHLITGSFDTDRHLFSRDYRGITGSSQSACQFDHYT